MLDMIALAFRSDSTRICTFMFGNAVSNVSFRFVDGITGSHHDMSHHSNDPEKLRQYQLINKWFVTQYAYLLKQLRDAKEGESSVLDNSIVVFASALSDGNSHNPHHLPIVVAGKAGGRINYRPEYRFSGRHAGVESLDDDPECVRYAGGTVRRQHGRAAVRSARPEFTAS